MITYEVAYKKAKELKPNINICTEYDKGWWFGCTDDANYQGGGGHTPVVVLKEDGEVVAPSYFMLIDDSEGKTINID